MRVKCSCLSPARTLYEAKAARTPLRIESATPTIKPISAHLPIALARTGVVFWKHRNRIRPLVYAALGCVVLGALIAVCTQHCPFCHRYLGMMFFTGKKTYCPHCGSNVCADRNV